MTRTEIEEKVRNFLIEDLEIDEEKISDDAKLKDDMGIDSLQTMPHAVMDHTILHRQTIMERIQFG